MFTYYKNKIIVLSLIGCIIGQNSGIFKIMSTVMFLIGKFKETIVQIAKTVYTIKIYCVRISYLCDHQYILLKWQITYKQANFYSIQTKNCKSEKWEFFYLQKIKLMFVYTIKYRLSKKHF